MIRIDEYLSELSERRAASLTEKVRLSVVVDGTATMESNKAVAIGLMVTELIINALRHAFPRNRHGKITVACKMAGLKWSLSVTDDGVGLSNTLVNAIHTGYGTKIIDALAKELDAQVMIKSSAKGTCVSVIHSASAA